jgi:hypothetical protein
VLNHRVPVCDVLTQTSSMMGERPGPAEDQRRDHRLTLSYK